MFDEFGALWSIFWSGRQTTMDASEFFNTVVKRNYEEFTSKQDDFRSLWNCDGQG
jgi:hypothetical protein